MEIVNIAAYKFIDIAVGELSALKQSLKIFCVEHNIKGSILLALEGINLMLSGQRDDIDAFKTFFTKLLPGCKKLAYKESLSQNRPYNRMLVKIKKETIAFGIETINPKQCSAPHLKAAELKNWYESDKYMVIIDARNQYETRLGKFSGALDLKLDNFRQFPEALKKLDPALKKKPVVTYCTGGIRCEKAATLMIEEGFEEVYQLQGGILQYFKDCQGAHYEGDCFVFDRRVAIDSNLQETEAIQCFSCRQPMPKELAESAQTCTYCGEALGS